MTNLYALLIGINDYPRKPLSGCINDVNAVVEYLKKVYNSNGVNLKIKRLTDQDEQKPTRENIITAFNHFEDANNNDVCLFYYSGHGSFSPAPEEFWTEEDKQNESFVCLDSRMPGGRDLMNKEMGYLIWKTLLDKPQVTFVAITDCCHSGTITKDVDNNGITDRMDPDPAFPQKVEDYLGFDDLVNNQRGYEITADPAGKRRITVRKGNHIHIAASRANQTSKELTIDGLKRGAFTHSLLKTLYSTGGLISYKELIDKTTVLVRNMVQDQHPGINIVGNLTATEKDKLFLSQENNTHNPKYLVYHDPKYSWCIKAGLLHGVAKGDLVIIDGLCETVITSTPAPDFSVLLSKEELGKTDNFYQATIQRKSNQPLTVSFAPDFSPEIKGFINSATLSFPSPFYAILPEGTGQYIIRAITNNEVTITLPGSQQPVFKPIPISNESDAAFFLDRIEIVSKWIRLLELTNPIKQLNKQHYKLKLYLSSLPNQSGTIQYKEVTVPGLINELYYWQAGEDNWELPSFKISITNTSSVPLWITNAYLGFNFSITTNFFDEMQLLAPGETAWLKFTTENGLDTDIIPLELDEEYSLLGYNEITEYLKFFISTEKLDISQLQQSGIEMPLLTTRDGDIDNRSPRIGTDSGKSITQISWTTETIGFKIIKPQPETSIQPGTTTVIQGLTLEGHPALTAKASITSSETTARSADGIAPPYATNNNSFFAPFDLSPGTRAGSAMDVLELFDVKNRDSVTAHQPLIVKLNGTRSATEDNIIPIGYDEETNLYFPLGYTAADGNIIIEALPEETPSDAAITQRSFLGSIKIYFQKVIGQKLGFAYEYPRLAIATLDQGMQVHYDSDGQKLRDAVAQAYNIILFIHGIIGDTEEMVKCIKTPLDQGGNTLEKATDLVLTFDYENLNTEIEVTADLLKKKLKEIGLDIGHKKQLTIIAHSMGGLVSRWLIEKLGGNKVVSKLIMLGTPNNGSPWADVRDMAEVLITFAINGAAFLKPWMFVLSGLGKLAKGMQVTLKQMDAETGIYTKLNDGTDPEIPYIIIAGNTRNIIVDYEKTASFIGKLFTRMQKRGVYDVLDSLLFKKGNDIAVAEESILTINGSETWSKNKVVFNVASDHLNYFIEKTSLKNIRNNNI